jgi:phage-related tail protein
MTGEVLNISPLVAWVVALNMLLTFALTIWNLMASGSRANAKRLDAHGEQLQQHDTRITAVEQRQESLPSLQNMHTLQLAIVRLEGEIKSVSQVMAGNVAIMERLERVVARHDAHLLEAGKR